MGGAGGQLLSFEISGYPDDLQYHDFTAFFNANGGFRWVKVDFKQGERASRMTVNANDAHALMALTGREIRPGRPLVIEPIGASGRPLQRPPLSLTSAPLSARCWRYRMAADSSSLCVTLCCVEQSTRSSSFVNSSRPDTTKDPKVCHTRITNLPATTTANRSSLLVLTVGL